MSYLNPTLAESIIGKVIPMENLERIEYTIKSPVSDNALKQSIIQEEMTSAGFTDFKAGTNRVCCFHPDYPNYVFKVALDKRGVADNLADIDLYQDERLTKHVTVLYESTGIVEVSEKVEGLRSTEELGKHFDEIKAVLMEINKHFLLDDIWIDQFMNWGYSTLHNKMVVLDYAYLFPKEKLDLKCVKIIDGMRCDGALKYTPTMTELVCRNCGRIYTFGELKDRAINGTTKEGDAVSFIGNLDTL